MNETGISVDEACSSNVIGTAEDYERTCNPDGTVKESSDTSTISIESSDNSAAASNYSLQVGLAVVVVLVLVLTVLISRKIKQKM